MANKNNDKNRTPAILNEKWLRLCDEEVRNMKTSFDVKRTLLHLLWLHRRGDCGCGEEHKLGKYCDNCGKHLYRRHTESAQAIITEQVQKN